MAEKIEARATVNLAGLRRGQVAQVDPTDPYIAELLAARILVPADDAREPGSSE